MNVRALFMAAFVSLCILAGCASFTYPPGMPAVFGTPGAIATGVAEGIPSDLEITYHYESTGIAPPAYEAVRISADGSASYVGVFGSLGYGQIDESRRAGMLSAESLRNVVLAFEEKGFFFLRGDGCVRDTRASSRAASGPVRMMTEQPVVSVSIRMNGISHTVIWRDGCRGGGPGGKDDPALNAFNALIDVLVDAVKNLPPGVAN